MNTVFRLAAAFAAGVAAMYYLDPRAGRRRRALMRDKGVAAGHDARDLARATSKRAANRMRGAVAKTRAKVSHRPIDDEQLHDRIRTKLGRLVDRPSAVEVKVSNGRVVLGGSALAAEIDPVVDAISTMQGVEDVDTMLSTRDGNEASQDRKEADREQARH